MSRRDDHSVKWPLHFATSFFHRICGPLHWSQCCCLKPQQHVYTRAVRPRDTVVKLPRPRGKLICRISELFSAACKKTYRHSSGNADTLSAFPDEAACIGVHRRWLFVSKTGRLCCRVDVDLVVVSHRRRSRAKHAKRRTLFEP